MSKALDEACYELSLLANRIIAHEGVLDGFGHVSVRHPDHPDRYLLSRSRSPELVEPADLLEFTLDSDPCRYAKSRVLRRAGRSTAAFIRRGQGIFTPSAIITRL